MTTIVPANRRLPLTAIRINNELAQQADSAQPYRTLLMAPKIDAGTVHDTDLTEIFSLGDAAQKLGRGSLAYEFCRGYFAQESGHPLFFLNVDDSSLTAREETLTFSGSGIQAGTYVLYISGERIVTNISNGQAPADIAADVASSVNANPDSLFTAAAAAAVVTLTSKNKGDVSGQHRIESNGAYAPGDALPSGLEVAQATKTSGAGTPDLADVLKRIPENTQYILVNTPYNEPNTVKLVNDVLVERNGATRKLDGYHITASEDPKATIGTLNSQFLTVMPLIGVSSEAYLSGALIGQTARIKGSDPAASLRGAVLKGIVPPRPNEILSDTVQNTNLLNKISAYEVSPAGDVSIALLATTYNENRFGGTDTSYFDLGVLLTLSYIRYDLDRLAALAWSGAKIGRDGVRYRQGQKIVTPTSAAADILARFSDWEERGLIEDRESFQKALVVSRDASNVNQINIVLVPNVVNELRILGMDIQFLL